MRPAAATVAIILVAASVAHADPVDEIGKKMILLEGAALELDKQLDVPASVQNNASETAERHLVQAQVAYGVGNYSDATILLYDVVEKYPQTHAYPEAVFYLAESLFQRGDNQTSREYFHKIIEEAGERSPHYQEALERLIELSIRLNDASRVQDYLARLDRLPTGTQLESVPYVRGKYAYFTGAYDDALRQFGLIGKDSKYNLQGRYFTGVTQVAKGDLEGAIKTYHDLVKLESHGAQDEKVIELAHLALGRIHYERDQPGDAIDHYQAIRRESPYFDEALFEVAWVYVKAKQFDKALRALELLSLAAPKSAMLPDVRILEGNLRIRKAQSIAGTGGSGVEEYAKANEVFEATRAAYEKPKADLDKLLASHPDPKQFFAELTGRAGTTLEMRVDVPEVALDWVKEEKDIGRVLGVTKTLDEIRDELDDTWKLLERMQRAVDSPSRVSIFPELAEKRSKLQEFSETTPMRQQLATHERVLTARFVSPQESAELSHLQQQRHDLTAKLATLPNSGDSYEERLKKAKDEYIELDKKAQEVEVLIISIEAELVALEKYYHDTHTGQKMSQADFEKEMSDRRAMVTGLRGELDAIRAEITAASDEAGVGDELAREEFAVRAQLSDAVKAEHAFMQRVSARMNEDDRKKVTQIGLIMQKAIDVDRTVESANGKIDKILDTQLADVKVTLAEERGHVTEYRKLLAEYEGESVDVGSEVVVASFEHVSKKFYEIAVRADVGLLDVSWAQKEQSQQTYDRMNLDYGHEKNTLDAEFRDVREEAVPPPDAPEEPPKNQTPPPKLPKPETPNALP